MHSTSFPTLKKTFQTYWCVRYRGWIPTTRWPCGTVLVKVSKSERSMPSRWGQRKCRSTACCRCTNASCTCNTVMNQNPEISNSTKWSGKCKKKNWLVPPSAPKMRRVAVGVTSPGVTSPSPKTRVPICKKSAKQNNISSTYHFNIPEGLPTKKETSLIPFSIGFLDFVLGQKKKEKTKTTTANHSYTFTTSVHYAFLQAIFGRYNRTWAAQNYLPNNMHFLWQRKTLSSTSW